MATPAQFLANRANAQLSTGPRTEEGKSAVARNGASHGLSAGSFFLLPHEDAAAYGALLAAFEDEHAPETPTESFLVTEMAQAQWKLKRAAALEAELLSGSDVQSWSDTARRFREDCSQEQALLKLNRYENSARRAWHKALEQLRALRRDAVNLEARQSRIRASETEAFIHSYISAPIPGSGRKAPETPQYEAKPIPAHLQREIDAHKRRDPLFDPKHDRSQMSKELRRFFEKQAA